MTTSINNATSAQNALADLLNLQGQSSGVGTPSSSDGAVSSTADNPAIWAAAQVPSFSLQTLDSVTVALSRASSVADTASAAGQTVADLLNRLKADAGAAAGSSASADDRQSLNSDFQSVLGQIQSVVTNAAFDGTNLVDGSQASTAVSGAASLTLASANLSLGGPLITLSATASIGTASAASGALSQIDASIASVNKALDAFNAQAKQVSAHVGFVDQVSDVAGPEVSGLIGSDLDAEGARLVALQTQQLLGGQAGSITSQGSQLLTLFR